MKAAAKALEVSPSMVYALISEGRLLAMRIGRKNRRGKLIVEESAIEAFKKQTREQSVIH